MSKTTNLHPVTALERSTLHSHTVQVHRFVEIIVEVIQAVTAVMSWTLYGYDIKVPI